MEPQKIIDNQGIVGQGEQSWEHYTSWFQNVVQITVKRTV